MDDTGLQNKGFKERAALLQKSAEAHVFAKVLLDVVINGIIPDQTEILLRFHRNNSKLCLMAKDGDYNIKVTQAKLFVSRYQPVDSVCKASLKRLSVTHDTIRSCVQNAID